MNRIAYTLFVAFVASLATLWAVDSLVPARAQSASEGGVITLDEVAGHDSADSCWKAIDGIVYDITEYIPNHPTPTEVVARFCGQEATGAWEGIGDGRGHSGSAERLLQQYRIGVLPGFEHRLNEPATEASAAEPVRTLPGGAGSAIANGNWADGTYYAELPPDSRGWIPIMELTVYAGELVAVHYDEIQRNEDGAVTASKRADHNYAQRWRNSGSGVSWLSAFPGYETVLRRTGSAGSVDAISGATSTHETFVRLADQLLNEAATAPGSE